MTCVSTIIPYASFAGTEVLFPCTKRDALALENPSLELEVGTLINGILRRKAAYFPASITFPPPIEITACVLFGIANASVIISSISTVSNSLYSNTVIPSCFSESMTSMPNRSISPFPKKITTCSRFSALRYCPIFFKVPFPTFNIDGIKIPFPLCMLSPPQLWFSYTILQFPTLPVHDHLP